MELPAATSARDIAQMIDHSLLHPTMTDDDLRTGCELADRYGVATVCVKPYDTPAAKKLLAGSEVGICAVIGFPHGNSSTRMKVEETREVINAGATEVDMVINIGKALGGDWGYVAHEIEVINTTCTERGAILKVIFENDYLQTDHIERLCMICSEERVGFVKTSTGYGFVKQDNGMYAYQGATDEHLRLMRAKSVGDVQIKAAGGVRTFEDVLRVRALGVSRIGATATAAIVDAAREHFGQ